MLLHPYSIVHSNQYYRLLSSDFVHNGFLHLVINEISLYVIGSDLEELLKAHYKYGSLVFLIIYLSGMIMASGLTTIRHYKDFGYSSAGASGSIIGCLFSFILLNPFGSSLYVPVLGRIANIYCGLFYLFFLIIYRRKTRNKMMSTEVHVFGALGGIIATALFMIII